MQPPDGSNESWQRIGKAISDLQWAHETLMRLIAIVQLNGLLTDRLGECVVTMSKAAVSLEGVVQEHLSYARRRKNDERAGL